MKRSFFALAALALLGGCLPNLDTLAPPRFGFMPEGSGLLRLDPPGVGAGEAVFRFNLLVENPNAFGLRLAGVEGTFFVDGRPVAGSSFALGADLPAEAARPLALELRVPLTQGSPLLADLSAMLAGQPTEVRLEASPVLAFGGLEQALPSVTLVSTTLEQPLALLPPRLSLDAAASGLTEASFERAVFEVVLNAENPGPLGFVFEASGLELLVAGQRVADLGAVRLPLPAFSQASVAVPFELSGASLELLAARSVAGIRGSETGISVSGAFRLELPGIAEASFAPRVLAFGVLEE